jgi:hypothetical protein
MMVSRTVALVILARAVCLAQGGACAQLRSAVVATYDFKPSKLTEAQRKKKSEEMDRLWNLVEAHPAETTPCLMGEMEEPDADRWFLFDAGGVLAKLAPSPAADRLILLGCERVDLNDVVLEEWVRRLTSLALRDVDISAAADRWMRDPRASYVVPQHAFTVGRAEGAFFLYGSMDEELATPALLKVVSDPAHPQRELALSLLKGLATTTADDAFQSLDLSGFPAQVQRAARSMLAARPIFQRRDVPKSTRQELLAVFQSITVQRNFQPFLELTAKVPDGERDVVTVMGPEDLPLIRKVRRAMAASENPHLMKEYPYFTGIIWTLRNRQ